MEFERAYKRANFDGNVVHGPWYNRFTKNRYLRSICKGLLCIVITWIQYVVIFKGKIIESSSNKSSQSNEQTAGKNRAADQISQTTLNAIVHIKPKPFVDSVNDLAIAFDSNLPKTENYFISPFSITIALSMLYEGTFNQSLCEGLCQVMSEKLGFNSEVSRLEDVSNFMNLSTKIPENDSNDTQEDRKKRHERAPFKLSLANSLWKQNDIAFNENFANVLKDSYKSEARQVNFRDDPTVTKVINQWIESKTNNRIKNMLSELSRDTVLVLVNAIYFKADWMNQFKKDDTYKANFTTISKNNQENSITKKVDMMHMQSWAIYQKDSQGNLFVKLPYFSKDIETKTEMVIMLPNISPAGKLTDFDMDKIDQVKKILDFEDEKRELLKVKLSMPKFKFEWKMELKDMLKKIGLERIYYPQKGDYFGICDGDLAVSKVIHQSFVAVDEKGTEAAAATAIIMTKSMMPMPLETMDIDIDRPFGFWIMHTKSKAILFSGKVIEPLQSEKN